MKITNAYCAYEPEKFKHAFGFKGSTLSGVWQTVVALKSEGEVGVGLGIQSVLWSDSSVFAEFGEQRGNELMFAVTEYAIKAIEGKDEIAAANVLINFVQTGFQYKTDGEQFGRERSLFGDESLYYPYCDCEDRAILYSILMRDLLGVKAALVYYPGHLATAICFSNGKVYGDYIEVGSDKYTICDPTYIGANVGMTMPNMNNAEAEVILI